MDVDRLSNLRVDKDNSTEQWQAFNRAQGARMSAMEHLVPEQMYSTEDARANGISAVKAIQLAAAEGQRIWTITQSNVDLALSQIELGEFVENDIRNSVAAGMEVTTHEAEVDFFGRASSGYIILNPASEAGAYKIGGGENGGHLVAIGAIATALDTWLSLQADIFIRFGGAEKKAIEGILGTIGRFLALIGITLDIFELVSACGHKGLIYTLFMLLGFLGPLLSLMALAAPFPILWGILGVHLYRPLAPGTKS